MQIYLKWLVIVLSASWLAACGGGGSGEVIVLNPGDGLLDIAVSTYELFALFQGPAARGTFRPPQSISLKISCHVNFSEKIHNGD